MVVVTNTSYVSCHMIRVKTGWQGLTSFQKFKNALKLFVGRVFANLCQKRRVCTHLHIKNIILHNSIKLKTKKEKRRLLVVRNFSISWQSSRPRTIILKDGISSSNVSKVVTRQSWFTSRHICDLKTVTFGKNYAPYPPILQTMTGVQHSDL